MAEYWCCIQADIMEQEIEQLKQQLAAAEQRAELAEADKKHLYELIAEQGKKIQEYESNPCIPANIALLAELEGLRFVQDAYTYLTEALKDMPGVLPQVSAKINSDEFKARFAQAERGQE